ncbi:MAG TPA: hypothetical protein PK644_04590 [bacterium]|nr:hypothetical protein [bacterium]
MGALIGGIVAVVLGIWGLARWFPLFVKGLQAAVPFFLLLGGIVAIAAGISDIKDRMEEQREKEKEKEQEKAAETPKPAEGQNK